MNASQALSNQRIDEIDTELLQVRQELQLDSAVDSRLQSFINLESDQKSSILAQLTSGEKSETATEWGFLKNIINIDCFFSSASGNCGRSDSDNSRDTSSATEAEKAAARRRAEDRLRKAREQAKRARDKAAKDKAELERLRKLKESAQLKKEQEEKLKELEEQKRKARAAEAERKRLDDAAKRQAAKAEADRKRAAAKAKADANAAEKKRLEEIRLKKEREQARLEALRLKREAERKRKADAKADAAAKAKEESDAVKQAEADKAAEEARRRLDEAEARRKEEAEKAAAAAAAAKRKEEEAAAAKKAAEEAARLRKKEEAERKRKEAEAARKAAEEARRIAAEEAARLKAAAEAAAKAKAEEEARARAAAAAKAARLKKIKDDYKRRRTQFTDVIGTKFFAGSGKQFAQANQFHILVYYTEAGAKKEEAIYFKESFSFKANNLRQAFLTFAGKIRSEIALMPLREFALIGNRKLLLTTSIFDDFFEQPIKKGENLRNDKSPYKYSGDEFKDDRISRLFIGFGFQKFLLDWPEATLDQDFEGYQVLQLIGKNGTWTKVGPNYQKATKVFEEKASQDQAYVILTHTSGKWYKVSGKQNTNALYLDAYLGLSGYLQGKGHYNGPFVSELKAGFRMKWQQDEENKAKFEKLKQFYKGDGSDKLQKPYTIYALTYDKRTHAIARLNWRSYYYMKKGLEDVARSIYDNVIRKNNDKKAYMALVRETVPLYCSEGDMTKKHICQRLIGYALYHTYLYADEKMTNILTSQSDRAAFTYVAYLGNSDKQDEAVMKKLHWNYGKATKMYKDFFKGSDAAFDYGVMGHSGKRGWWQVKSLYNGAQSKMDVYRLLALHSQTNLKVYTGDAADEEAAKVITKKAHEKKMREMLEKLNALYKGKGEPLWRAARFFVVDMHKKTSRLRRPILRSSKSARAGIQYVHNWVFNSYIKREQPYHFIFGVYETGMVYYCSLPDFKDPACATMIGQALYGKWLIAPKEVVGITMLKTSPDYKYYAIVQNTLNEDGKGIQEAVRVNLTFDLGTSRQQYRALFAPVNGVRKYNIGVITHYGMHYFTEPRTAVPGSASRTDVYQMITDNVAKEDGVYGKPAEASEEGLRLVTAKTAAEQRAAAVKKLRGLYAGKGATLYRLYSVATVAFDKRQKRHFRIWLDRRNNFKASLWKNIEHINRVVLNPRRDAEYLIYVRESKPIYCTQAWNTTVCREMLGRAVWNRYLMLDHVQHEKNEQTVVDVFRSSLSLDWKYVAYVRNIDQKVVKRVNLTNNYGNSLKQLRTMVGKGKDYDIGFMGHNSKQNFWSPIGPVNARRQLDCYQLLGEWLQVKGGLFKEAPKKLDEAGAGVKTKEEWDAYLKGETAKLNALYKGAGEALSRRYLFYVITIHRSSNNLNNIYGARHSNMKQAVRALGSRVYHSIIKKEQDRAYLYVVKETTAFHCSEGALDTEFCRIMLGWAMYYRKLDPSTNVFYNTHLPGNHPDARYVAYLRDKASKEAVRVNLTANWGKALRSYREMIKGKDAKYVAGVIGHTRNAGWWSPFSTELGDKKYFDMFLTLADYAQKTLKVHKDSGIDEKAANVTTRRELESKWKSELDALKKLYKGKGETLQKNAYSFVATINEHSNQIRIGSQYNVRTLKATYNYHVNWIYNAIIKPARPLEYVIGLGSSRAVLQCSDGKPTESVPCQRIIGWALVHNYFREGQALPWDRSDEKRLFDNRISMESELFEYYAIVMDHRKDGSPIKKVVLGNSAQRNEALAAYRTLFTGGAQAEATVGVFVDSRNGKLSSYRMTRYKGALKFLDTYEMIAKYCQTELKSYDGEAADEKAAKVKTQAEFNDYLKESKTKLRALYAGDGETLARKHRFYVIGFDKKSLRVRDLGYGDRNNMKTGMALLAQKVYNNIVRYERDEAYLMLVQDTGVLHCSEGEMKKPICRRMIGWALRHGRLFAPRKAVDPKISTSSNDYHFVAYLKTDKGEASVMNLTKSHGTSVQMYYNLFKNWKGQEKRYVTGILGHTGKVRWWSHPVTVFEFRYNLPNGAKLWKTARRAQKEHDTWEMLAEVMQEKFDAFKEDAKDEKSAKLQTLKALKEKQEAAFKKFKSNWKGTGDQLAISTWMYIVYKDRRSKAISWYGPNRHPRNMQQQFASLAQETYNRVIKPNRDWMLVLQMIQYGPVWCSEGDLTSPECTKIAGQSIKHGTGWHDVSREPQALDKYIPSKDLDYQYVAFVENTKDDKVVAVNLTNNWAYARSAYNNLFQGGKDRQYNIGVIAHTARQGFWYPKSLLSGREKNQDSYAVYFKYWQKEKKLWTKDEVSEKNCNLNTTKEMNEYLEKKWKAAKELFKGSGDQLFKRYLFVAVTYHKRARTLSQIYMKYHQDLKKAFDGLIYAVQQRIVKPQHEQAFLYLARETVPFHCSEGDLTEQLCQRMIGYALYNNWMYADKKMTDRYISSASAKYHFVAYLREKDGGKIVKQALVKNQGKSKSRLDTIVGKFKKYDAGVMGHTAIMGRWIYPISQLKGSHKNFDVYELIAKFCQDELKLYKDNAYDEKGIKLVTQKQIIEKQQKALKKLQELFKGSGERLYKQYYFLAVSYNRRTKAIGMESGFHAWNMKNAMNRLTKAIFNNIIKRNADKAFTFHVQTNGPFYCSEGELTKLLCQRAIGYAIHQRWQFGDHKMYNLMISNKDVNYQYVAYLRKHPAAKDSLVQLEGDAEKGDLVMVNLTNNWGQATKRYNALWKGNEPEYQTGVISHTQRQQFWGHKSHYSGNLKNHDIYEMLADFTQTERKNFTKDGAKEETIGLKTKKVWDEHLKKEFDKLKDLNKGTSDTLFKHYHFVAMVYGRQSHVISQRHYTRYWNMKQAMQGMAQAIYNQVVKKEKDEAYLFLVRETTAFHCSEGDLDKPLCQRMIGQAIVNNWLIPEKKLVNKYLSSASKFYRHVAYLRDGKGEVTRLNLTKNYGTSLAQFHAFVDSDDSTYVAGIIGHSAQNKWWAKHSKLRGSEKNHDCLEIIAEYAQKKLELYKESGTDEKAAKVLVREKMEEKHKSALKKMRELYSGKGEKLYKNYVFYAVTYDKNTHKFGQLARSGHYTMKAAMNVLVTNVYNQIVSKHREVAYMFFSYETVPFHCSEGKLDTVLCQRMIGHALRSNWQKADKKMIDAYIATNDLDYQYVAYVKDGKKDDAEVKRVNLTNNWSAAVARYNQLVKGNTAEYTVGILSHTKQQNWWYPYTQKTGNLKYTDVDVMLAEYCQKKLEVWKEDGGDEKAAKLQTKKEFDDKLKEADKKLKALFTGSGDTLHQKYTFTITFKHKRSNVFSVPFNSALWSFRNAMIKMTQFVYQHVHKAEQDFVFLFSIKETVPIYCSEEGDKDFKKKECQQLIGWALYNKMLLPPRKMVDKRLSGARALYIGYLVEKDGDKVVVKNLTTAKGSAQKVFLSLFQGEDQLYKAGVMGHTSKIEWSNPVSALKGSEKNLDVWEAIARYAQTELKLYKEHALEEKAAKLLTKKMILEKQQKALKKLTDMWKGAGDQLWKSHRFSLVTMDRSHAQKFKKHTYHWYRSLKQSFDVYVQRIFTYHIKKNKDTAFLHMSDINGVPLFCSDPDMKSSECRQMYGYDMVITGYWMRTPPKELFDQVEMKPINDDGSSNTKFTYVTVVKDFSKEEPKMEVIKLNTTNKQAAQQKHDELVEYKSKDSFKVGFLTHTAIRTWLRPRTRIPGFAPNNNWNRQGDVLELIAEYVQSKVAKFEKAEVSEKSLGIMSLKEHQDDMKKFHEKALGLYKGKNEKLLIADTFQLSELYQNKFLRHCTQYNDVLIKNAINRIVKWMYHARIKNGQYRDTVFLMYGKRNNAIWCSKGEMTDEKCQILIGWVMTQNRLWPNREMVDPGRVPDDTRWIGIFKKKDGSVVRTNLTKNYAASTKTFMGQWKSREYVTGLMAHTKLRTVKHLKTRYPNWFVRKNHDVYTLYAEYAQKKYELFKGEGNRDEKSAGYDTVAAIQKKKAELAKKIRDFSTNGERFKEAEIIYYILMDKRYGKMKYRHWRSSWSMKAAYNTLAIDLSNWANTIWYQQTTTDDYAWLIISRKYGPQQCSEKDFQDKLCRQMFGYALRVGVMWAHRSVSDRYLPKNSEQYQWLSYTWNIEKRDDPIQVRPLGKNFNLAVKAHNKLVKSAERNVTTAYMGHTQYVWAGALWTMTTNYTGPMRFLDTYEMIGTYYQRDRKIFDKPCGNPKDCRMVTAKSYNAGFNKRMKTMKDAYKGKNDILYRNYRFCGLEYARSSNDSVGIGCYNQRYMNNVMNWYTNLIKNRLLKPVGKAERFAWMLVSTETGPLFCSENANFTAKAECTRMIGYAIKKKLMWADKKVTNDRLAQSSPKYVYIAIVQKDAKSAPERIELERGLQASKDKFKALLKKGGADQKYELGIMGHAQKRGFGWQFPTSANFESRSKQDIKNDVEEMLANFHLKVLNIYNKELNDEAAARLITQKVHIAKAKAKYDKVMGLYKGKGEQLHRAYHFGYSYYNKRDNRIGWGRAVNSNNFKHAFKTLADHMFSTYFRHARYNEMSWMLHSEKGAMACSEEKKMEDPVCMKMLGFVIHKNYIYRINEFDRKLLNPDLHVWHPDHYYFALVQNQAKLNEPPVMKNLTYDWSVAYAQFHKLCPSALNARLKLEHQVCVLGSTRQKSWWYPRTVNSGISRFHDTYFMIAKHFLSKNKDAFGTERTDEKALKIKTRVEWAAYLKEKLEGMKKSFEGDSSPTFQLEYYRLFSMNKYSNAPVQVWQLRTNNPRYAVDNLAQRAVKYFHVDRAREDGKKVWNWVISSYKGGVIYASQDMKSEEMQRLLGYMIIYNYMCAPKELVDPHIPAASEKYHFFALLQEEKGDVIKMDLPQNQKQARAQFNGLFPANKALWKYKDGVMGHTSRNAWRWNKAHSSVPTKNWMFEQNANSLPAKYMQKTLSKWAEPSSDLEALGLETKKDVAERTKESLEKGTKLWNSISAERAKYHTYTSLVMLRHRDGYLRLGPQYTAYQMRTNVKNLYTWVHNHYVRNKGQHDHVDFILFARDYGVIYSSIDDLKDEKNQIMLGYALQTHRLYLGIEFSKTQQRNPLAKTTGYHFLACLKGSKDVEKYFTRSISEANQRQAAIRNDKKYSCGWKWRTGYTQNTMYIFKVDSKRRGRTQRWPAYQAIASWLQGQGQFDKAKPSLEALGITTYADNFKKRDARIALLKSFYKPKTKSRLVKTEQFCVLHQQYTSNVLAYGKYLRVNNVEYMYEWFAKALFNRWYAGNFAWGQDRPIMIFSKKAGPIYWSLGDDLTTKEAQRFLGRGFENPACFSPPVNNPASKTKGIFDAPQAAPVMHIALADDGKKVVRLNFTANRAQSIKEFKALVGEGKKYKSGLLMRNRMQNTGNVGVRVYVPARASSAEFEDHGMDVHETVARYLQNLGLYKKVNKDGKGGLETIAERDARWKIEGDRLRKLTSAIPTGQLFRTYNFDAVFYRPSTGAIWRRRYNTNQMQNLVNTFQAWANQQMKVDVPYTMVGVGMQAGCLLTTDKAGYTSYNTQRAIGYAIRVRLLHYAVFDVKDKILLDVNTPDHQARFFAIVKDTKTDEIKRYNLTMRDQGKAQRQFNELTKDKTKIGAFGYDGLNPRWVGYASRVSRYEDVDAMLGQFAQRRLNRCKKNEPETLVFKKDRDEAIAKTTKAFRQKAEQNKKFVADLRAHMAKHPALRNRFPRAVYFSVYSFRAGHRFRGTTPFWRVSYTAYSYAAILRQAAARIQALNNQEAANLRSKTVQRVYRHRNAETKLGAYTHMAVLGSGAPRILWSSTGDIKNCKHGQTLLGYIWRNSDPSGSPRPFWKDGRSDFLKYHAWKWTQAVAMTKDRQDYFKSFSVYEHRVTGKVELKVCPGTESKKGAAAISAAQKKCVAEFTKDTNPVRSDKNVRGFFVSGTQFIFSKHEDTPDGDEMNKGEVPAYGALGRWILQTLPKEDTDASIKGSLSRSNGDIFKVEGLWNNKIANFWVAAMVEDDKGKRVEVRKERARAVGTVELRMMRREPWWLSRSQGPFVTIPRAAGVILVEDNNEWFPVAVNNDATQLDSRPAITAIGSLLADKRLHASKPRNLFEKCKAQSNFDGKITVIYELWTSDTIREECKWCAQDYAETAAALLKARPGLRKASKERKQRAFDKAYAPKFKAAIKEKAPMGEYKFGATLLNKKHEFITIAEGADSPADVYFALGKYARENCRTLQQIADPRKAGFKGQPRKAN